MMDMKRIYNILLIMILSLFLLPLGGCFDMRHQPGMYEADGEEMQRENHIVGATLKGMQGLVIPTREHLLPVYGCYGRRSIRWLFGRNCRHLGDEILYFQSRTGMAQIPRLPIRLKTCTRSTAI